MTAKLLTLLVAAALLSGAAHAQPEAGLVGHWDLRAGEGAVARDLSGHGRDGQIHGATWVRTPSGAALSFDGSGDTVDFGDDAALKIAGDMTASLWVKLMADPYPNAMTNWYLLNCEDYRHSGFCLRIQGSTGLLYYRASWADSFSDFSAATTIPHGAYCHVVFVRKGETASFFLDGNLDTRSSTKAPAPGAVPFSISDQSQSCQGLIDEVRVYDRALSIGEIVGLYKAGAGAHGKDTSAFGKFAVRPYFYFADHKAILEVKFKGLLPLAAGDEVALELGPPGGRSLQVQPVTSIPEAGEAEFTFPLDKLSDGAYELRAVLRNGGTVKAQEAIPFHYPPLPVSVVSPAKRVAPALARAAGPVPYTAEVGKGGGLRVRVKGHTYAVESSYSYPQGGENRLTSAADAGGKGEPDWRVTTSHPATTTYRMTASGKFYTINREVRLQPTRILVKDTITNTSDADVGIIFANTVSPAEESGVKPHSIHGGTPLVFLSGRDHGLGMVALDDVYRVQLQKREGGSIWGMGSDHFGLAKGGSYALEWAIYPQGTGDFYDFVNTMRHDEGLDNRTVDGCYAITHSGRWLTETPPRELIEYGGVKYASSGCLTKITDDPALSIEGFEFIEYPRMCETLRQTYLETKRLYPGLKVMFHVAPHLRVARAGDERYADSRMLDRSGQHSFYDAAYFPPERWAQGWAFFPYYPTLENSFGKAMLDSVEPMMDGLGTDGVFADGLLSGYGPSGTYDGYTYDCWDGHSVEIDPQTKMITRKMGSVALLGREAVTAYVRKINARGGRVIINEMSLALRDFCKENTWFDAETNDGDNRCAQLYLSPTVIGLAQPNKSADEREVYDDIRAKLAWGALYAFYYWSCNYTHPVVTTVMYPITPQEMRPGLVKGKERLITLNSGTYGWAGSRDLHYAVLADGRGVLAPASFTTTVDGAGVRTQIALQDREMAVLKRIPVALQAAGPVNLVLEQYDAGGLRLTCNGRGAMKLTVTNGDLRVKPGATYTVTAGRTFSVKGDKGGRLSFGVPLAGQMRIAVVPAIRPQ